MTRQDGPGSERSVLVGPYRRLFHLLIFFWALGVLGSGFALASFGVRIAQHHRLVELWQRGEPSSGVVRGKRKERRLRMWRHWLEIEHRVGDRTYIDAKRARHEDWNELRVGDPVELRCASEEPSRCAAIFDPPLAQRVTTLLPLLFPTTGLLLLGSLVLLVRWVRWLRLVHSGTRLSYELVGPAEALSERQRLRFRVGAETFERRMRVPVARFPTLEVPAGDMILLGDPSRPGRVAAIRASAFVQGPAEKSSSLLAGFAEEWAKLLPSEGRRTDEARASLMSARWALLHLPEDGGRKLDGVLVESAIARRAFRRWLFRPGKGRLSHEARAALETLESYQQLRDRAREGGALVITVFAAGVFLAVGRAVIGLETPADVIATAALSAAIYPLFRLLFRSWT